MRWLIVLFIFNAQFASAETVDFDRESVLSFNTVCSYCHEGQCSGRLTFALGPEATFTHIRRYAGEVDDDCARNLQELLEFMKQECAFPYLPEVDICEPVYQDVLDFYRDSPSGNYFIPLGNLELGSYNLSLHFATSEPLRVEVLNEYFDFLVDHCSGCGCGDFSETLVVEEASKHYLRLRSQKQLKLEKLELQPE